MDGISGASQSIASTADYVSKFSMGGLVSGLDVNSVINDIMKIESQPLQDLAFKKVDIETQLSAWRELNGYLASLLAGVNLLSQKTGVVYKNAKSSDEDYIKSTASSTAKPGSYKIKVVSMAKTHQLKLQNPVGDLDVTTFGTGTLTFTVDGDSHDVQIDSSNNTLRGVVDAINNSGAGVSASWIELDNDQYQMVITSDTSGTEGTITYSYSSGISSDLATTDMQAASDAEIYIGDDANHLDVVRSSNVINDSIVGVTLELQAVSTNYVDVEVTADSEGTENNINTLINGYNNLVDFFGKQFFFDSTTGEQGVLQGNTTLIQIQNKIERMIFGASSNNGKLHRLVQIGITADTNGKLYVSDQTLFDDAVNNQSDDLAKLFNDETYGIAARLKEYVDELTQFGTGTVSRQDKLAMDQIEAIDETIQEKSDYLSRVEALYRKQFNEMETAMNLIQNQMSTLTSSLASMMGS